MIFSSNGSVKVLRIIVIGDDVTQNNRLVDHNDITLLQAKDHYVRNVETVFND